MGFLRSRVYNVHTTTYTYSVHTVCPANAFDTNLHAKHTLRQYCTERAIAHIYDVSCVCVHGERLQLRWCLCIQMILSREKSEKHVAWRYFKDVRWARCLVSRVYPLYYPRKYRQISIAHKKDPIHVLCGACARWVFFLSGNGCKRNLWWHDVPRQWTKIVCKSER